MRHRTPLVPALTAAIASFLVSAVAHGQQTVPPDPVDVAPPLDLTVPTDIFDATEFL